MSITGLNGGRPPRAMLYCSCASALLLLEPSIAQAEQAEPTTVTEVVVTASKTGAQKLQDLPQAISALDEVQLQRQGARAFNDYVRSVPGVAFVDRGPTENKIVIRGVSEGPFSPTAPTTGIYIDEAPIAEPNRNADLNMFDVERIEVLRGPQGTLYGSGSMGGALRIILNKPNASAIGAAFDGGYATTRHGSDSYTLNGMVNVPLIDDRLAIRAVGYYREDGGFIDEVSRGIQNVNSDTVKGGRLMARLNATNDLTINATVAYQKTNVNGRPQEDLNLPPLEQFRLFPERLDADWKLYNVEADWDFGWAKLVSSTSYYDKSAFNSVDYSAFVADALGLLQGKLPFGIQNNNIYHSFSQELRLSGNRKPIRWVAGVFYSDETTKARQFVDSAPLVPLLGSPLPPIFDSSRSDHTKQVALFGEATYDFTHRLHGTVGMRWFRFEQESKTASAESLQAPESAFRADTSASDVNWKFQLQYDVTKDNLLYIQAAQGFRMGGVNQPVPGVCGTAGQTYQPDSLWNYELGIKNTFLNHRLTFNVAAYQIEWDNMQVFRSLPCGMTVVQNAGHARSRGVEAEVVLVPLSGLQFNASVAYTNAKLDKASFPLVEGSRLAGVPDWSGYLSAQYSFPLAGQHGYVRGDFQYVGKSVSDVPDQTGSGPFFGAYPQRAYSLVGLRAGISSDRWEAAVYVRNLLDERADTFIRDLGLPDLLTSTVTRPRTIGVDLKVRY